jgi:hypothetical protein
MELVSNQLHSWEYNLCMDREKTISQFPSYFTTTGEITENFLLQFTQIFFFIEKRILSLRSFRSFQSCQSFKIIQVIHNVTICIYVLEILRGHGKSPLLKFPIGTC